MSSHASQEATKFNNLGVEYFNNNKYSLALSCFNKAIELDPNNSTAIANRKITLKKYHNYLRAKLTKNKIYIASAILVIFAVLFLKSIYNKGYTNGLKEGAKNAYSDAKNHYNPKIDNLKAELNTIVKTNENKIATMNNNHYARLEDINVNYRSSIEQMTSAYSANISQMNEAHLATLTSLEQRHRADVETTKTQSYNSGQKNMTERIGEVYDLDAKNKALKDDWNATVYINRE